MKLAIIIPAYNEATRIEKTLNAYLTYFNQHATTNPSFSYTIIIVPNGCTDQTVERIATRQQAADATTLHCLVTPIPGKWHAIKMGFEYAVHTQHADLIGFVDADLATRPAEFYALIANRGTADGIIASRYMPTSQLYPPRPFIKQWGRKLIYNTLVALLFGIRYYDYQCGAKVFTREVVATITPQLTVTQWAGDIEFLYLCHVHNFHIIEHATIWYDQTDSKFRSLSSGIQMIQTLFKLWWQHRTKRT